MLSSATKQDIRPFVRAFWKEQQRFPTTDETLDWLKANSRYSGEWEDGESKRAKRVGQILAFTEQSFDPKKMSQGEHQPVSLQMGRFSWWVRQNIGSALTGHIANLREFDPVAMTVSRTEVSVPAKFVETFLVVADFCLQQDPLENKAVPTNRIKKLWAMVDRWGCLESAVFSDSPGTVASHGCHSDFRPPTSQRESLAMGSHR